VDSILLRTDRLYVVISGNEILKDISFEIKRREQWAIFGETGTGKTVLAYVLSGNQAHQGQISFPAWDFHNSSNPVVVVDRQHRFRDLRNQQNFYYQQRYNAIDSQATMTVAEYLNAYEESGRPNFTKSALVEKFQLREVLNQPLIQLSNGENKRLQILKAVLLSPELLILDEPYIGLDADGRIVLDGMLSALTDSGQHLLLLSSRDHVPGCFNRYASLKNGRLQPSEHADDIRIHKVATAPVIGPFPSGITFPAPDFEYAVRMKDVHVRYEGKSILEGINWNLEKGACCALTGHNGAGKSTLLSLITGDNPQAYANEIYLFDRKRGTGESIWDIKQKVGFLSPELQLYFDSAATAYTTLASGFFDTIGLFRQLSVKQEILVMEWLQFLDCREYAGRLLNTLPAGIQRLILLGRAMIKNPPLLILDEPCQGLDAAHTALTLGMVDRYCALNGASLIYVSHYETDFPACIT
jgi:molybdate transport system ATP-binding protein